MASLKFAPRLNIYKSSNVTFDHVKYIAKSYGWWTFVAVIDGQVVFNSFPYSVTTRRHQYHVRALLSELGIEIDLEVSTKLSLDYPAALTDAVVNAVDVATKSQEKAMKARANKATHLERAASALRSISAIEKLIGRAP